MKKTDRMKLEGWILLQPGDKIIGVSEDFEGEEVFTVDREVEYPDIPVGAAGYATVRGVPNQRVFRTDNRKVPWMTATRLEYLPGHFERWHSDEVVTNFIPDRSGDLPLEKVGIATVRGVPGQLVMRLTPDSPPVLDKVVWASAEIVKGGRLHTDDEVTDFVLFRDDPMFVKPHYVLDQESVEKLRLSDLVRELTTELEKVRAKKKAAEKHIAEMKREHVDKITEAAHAMEALARDIRKGSR